MKNILLFLILLSIYGNSEAEWIYVAKTKKGLGEKNSFTAYADPKTIRKRDNMAKMWSLYDYKLSQKQNIRSVRQKSEYNCIQKKHRQLFLSAYSGNMSSGETIIIYNHPKNNWERTTLGSVRMAMLKFACSWHPKLPPRDIPNITVVKLNY